MWGGLFEGGSEGVSGAALVCGGSSEEGGCSEGFWPIDRR